MKKSKALYPCKDDKKPKSPILDIGISIPQLDHLLFEARTKTILTWNYKGIKRLPASLIQEASNVKQIYLKKNLIIKLPNNLGCFQNLTILYLYGNNIEHLPDSIGDIKTLNVLDISNNKLKDLSVSVTRLSSLRSLVAANNELSFIPPEICCLTSLSLLILTGNRLKSLPESVSKLKGLQGLHIDNNLMHFLPHSLIKLQLLLHLSCCSNYLVNLPSQPFRGQPTLYFDNNQELNYLPFCLLQDLQVGYSFNPFVLPSYGCFVNNPIKNNSIKVGFHKISSNPSVLNLPSQLRSISLYKGYHKLVVPPLLELCLRFLEKGKEHFQFQHILEPGILPVSLTNYLEVGPIVFCVSCRTSQVFTYASIIAITINITSQSETAGQEVPAVIYFCSDSCALSYLQKVNTLSGTYNMWLREQLAQPLDIEITSL